MTGRHVNRRGEQVTDEQRPARPCPSSPLLVTPPPAPRPFIPHSARLVVPPPRRFARASGRKEWSDVRTERGTRKKTTETT